MSGKFKGECFRTEISGFEIVLSQGGPDNFTVQYGKQFDKHLTYTVAAAKLGQAIMHALACESRLDNREWHEAREF